MLLLIFLQNAWGVEEGYVPSYERESFRKSHTSKRLTEAIPDGTIFEIRNCSPKIGIKSDSYFKADLEYIKEQINTIKPTLILACGKSARKAFEKLPLDIPIVYMPHPTYRALSKKITGDVRDTIARYQHAV